MTNKIISKCMNCDSTTDKTVIVYIILVSWGDNLKNAHTISQQQNYSTKKNHPNYTLDIL